MPKKERATDRHGGPGSSHQNPGRPPPDKHEGPAPGQPTNPDRSRVSGGGGERDRHHTHPRSEDEELTRRCRGWP